MSERDPLLPFRATGRTFRMLGDAITLAKEGKTVHIIAATEKHFDHMRETALERSKSSTDVTANRDWVKIGRGQIKFLSANHPRWDWRSERIAGVSKDAPIFIDHYTFEFHFANIIYGWLRWFQ